MLLRRLVLALVPLLAVLPLALAAPAQAGIPRTYDAALHHFELAKQTEAVKRFVTPSGNIYCSIAKRGPKGCEISEGGVKDPEVCPGNPVSDTVGRIEFRGGRAVPVCNTDTIRQPGAKVLPYGVATKVGKFACISEKQGVTCINITRTEGFFLHKGEYVIFNAG